MKSKRRETERGERHREEEEEREGEREGEERERERQTDRQTDREGSVHFGKFLWAGLVLQYCGQKREDIYTVQFDRFLSAGS